MFSSSVHDPIDPLGTICSIPTRATPILMDGEAHEDAATSIWKPLLHRHMDGELRVHIGETNATLQ